MKIESLNLNLFIENLLPGIVMFVSLIVLLPFQSPIIQNNEVLTGLSKSEFILAVIFLSSSYLLGLVSAITSRFFVDWVSELFIRPLILRQYSHKTYDQLKATFESLPDEKQNWRKAWNEAYRASLRYVTINGPEKAAEEVARRREQGRLVRNLFFTLVISSAALTQIIRIKNWGLVFIAVLIAALFAVCSYAYAEYSTFAEAILHLPEINTKKSKMDKNIHKG